MQVTSVLYSAMKSNSVNGEGSEVSSWYSYCVIIIRVSQKLLCFIWLLAPGVKSQRKKFQNCKPINKNLPAIFLVFWPGCHESGPKQSEISQISKLAWTHPKIINGTPYLSCHTNQGSGESSALPTFDIGSKLAELKQTRKLGTAITMKVVIIISSILIIIIISSSSSIITITMHRSRLGNMALL